ncbi:MAG TPA: YicC/YloC family endoribonuclease [Caldimonas sp.]|jgi:uncharacterized protein (TIGR00255 family)|nr:YicC/YloC family endoribonuclease [Caldimonas sp.]HEX2542051.1 YicC/YloC family endoribonuclease [Caldimonas sp.]
MTGYANASASPVEAGSAALHEPRAGDAGKAPARATVGVEIRSVNGRFLDLSLRLPDEFRGLEPALRELLTGRFKRGKIELRLTSGSDPEHDVPEPTAEQLDRLLHLERRVQDRLREARPLSVHEVLQWCRGTADSKTSEAVVLEVARRSVDGLAEARAREGTRLAAILQERVEHLRGLAASAEPLVPAAVARQQQRFIERWTEALEKANGAGSVSREAIEERALNEAAAYAIRIDVAEELARLRSHLDEVARLLAKGGEVGKRLEFLIQELLREANTLGSKSPSIEMTTLAVDMKVAIEQLREQVQNVE